MTKIYGLIIVGAVALAGVPARAGMPVMDDLILTSAPGQIGLKAKPQPRSSGAGSQGVSPYKAYRDRLGFGSSGNGPPRLRR